MIGRLRTIPAVVLAAAVWLSACVSRLPGEEAGGSGVAAGAAPPCASASCTPDPTCVGTPPSGSPVSNFESGCADGARVDGRDGGWFVRATRESVVDPDPHGSFHVSCGGAANSCFAACVSGALSGGGWPTAALRFLPRLDGTAYDVTRYRGISFYFSVRVGPSTLFSFQVPLATDAVAASGGGAGTDWVDPHMVPLNFPPAWQRIEIPFSDLYRGGPGSPETWDPTKVVAFQWEVAAATEAADNLPFTFCVDEVELLPG